MAKKYHIAVMGVNDAILPFRMLGFDTIPVINGEEAKAALATIQREEHYGVVYLTEDIASQIPDTLRELDTVVTPTIILIPTHRQSLGIGMARIQENLEKAIGADIL